MASNNLNYAAVNAERKKITQAARELAEKKRAASPYAVEKQGEMLDKLAKYVEEQQASGKPLTIAGFILALGIPKRSWYALKDGTFDPSVEEYKILHGVPLDADSYITEDGEEISLLPWSEIVERCYLLAQNEREEACMRGKAGNVVGNIFLLKSQHGLSDAPEQIQSQTNIQIVANADMALKALDMCK